MNVDVLAALPRLAQRLGGADAVLAAAERLSGGASMETWAFAVETLKGERRDLILRRRSAPFDPDTARSVSLTAEA
ncbi:MAG: phosphotransferase family protein, partial [Phenylobacterium sp.]